MIVLVEGVDGSGKTTLCSELRQYGYVFTEILQSDKQYGEYIKCARSDTVHICDRSFLSDLAYRLADGKSRRGMDLHSMMNILFENGVKVIFCHTDSAYEDAMKRGEDDITSECVHNEINHIYNLIFRMLKIFTKTEVDDYNWKTDKLSDVIKFIERR